MGRNAVAVGIRIAQLTQDAFEEIDAYVHSHPDLGGWDYPRNVMGYGHVALYFEMMLLGASGDLEFSTQASEAAYSRHIEFWCTQGSRHGCPLTNSQEVALVFDKSRQPIVPVVKSFVGELVSGDQKRGQSEMVVSVFGLFTRTSPDRIFSHIGPLLQSYLKRLPDVMSLSEANRAS